MKTRTTITTLLLAFMFSSVHAEDKVRELSDQLTKPITFKFVDEAGNPIKGTFTLHHTKNGEYVKNWHRYKPLNEQGVSAPPKSVQF